MLGHAFEGNALDLELLALNYFRVFPSCFTDHAANVIVIAITVHNFTSTKSILLVRPDELASILLWLSYATHTRAHWHAPYVCIT